MKSVDKSIKPKHKNSLYLRRFKTFVVGKTLELMHQNAGSSSPRYKGSTLVEWLHQFCISRLSQNFIRKNTFLWSLFSVVECRNRKNSMRIIFWCVVKNKQAHYIQASHAYRLQQIKAHTFHFIYFQIQTLRVIETKI